MHSMFRKLMYMAGGLCFLILYQWTPTFAQGATVDSASTVYLPIYARPLVVEPKLLVVNDNARQGICFDAMTGVAAASNFCPLAGNYPALTTSGRAAYSGRQGDKSDVGWKGVDTANTPFVRPQRTVSGFDALSVALGTYDEAGIFDLGTNQYTVIEVPVRDEVTSADAEQMSSPFLFIDFVAIMKELVTEGQLPDLPVTGSFPVFWDRFSRESFMIRQCGFQSARWVYKGDDIRFTFSQIGPVISIPGKFSNEVLDKCMGEHRYIGIKFLMTAKEAAEIQIEVQKRRNAHTAELLDWIPDLNGLKVGFWGMMSGGVGYYGYRLLNSTGGAVQTGLFLFVPEGFGLDCIYTGNMNECKVAQPQPNQ